MSTNSTRHCILSYLVLDISATEPESVCPLPEQGQGKIFYRDKLNSNCRSLHIPQSRIPIILYLRRSYLHNRFFSKISITGKWQLGSLQLHLTVKDQLVTVFKIYRILTPQKHLALWSREMSLHFVNYIHLIISYINTARKPYMFGHRYCYGSN